MEEFAAEKAWWGSEQDGFASRVENEQAWRVSIDTIKAGNYGLDPRTRTTPTPAQATWITSCQNMKSCSPRLPKRAAS